jgi:hypothetical protein
LNFRYTVSLEKNAFKVVGPPGLEPGTKGILKQPSNTSLFQTIFCLKLIGVTLSNAYFSGRQLIVGIVELIKKVNQGI